MKKRIPFLRAGLFVSVLFLFPIFLHANNIRVTGTTLVGRNTSSDYVQVKFNVTWDNSFRTSSGAANWDAAWIFIKYKIGATGVWKHATLSTTGHNIPSGGSTSQPADGTGIFIYPSSVGSGTFTLNGVELRWNYGTDGVPDESKIYVKVFAIEMVYVPQGNFQVGSGGQNTGEFRTANDVSATGTAATFTITSATITLQGNNTASTPTNISTRAGAGNDQLTGTTSITINASFPTGYNGFYCMKHEISQGQYRDFLNTLTYDQQATRTTNSPAGAMGTGALVTSGTYRQIIEIKNPGSSPNTPAFYGCDLSGNNVYDEANDGEWIACNYLSWNDVAAFLDWAALRPMTELEYEKASRGTLNPVVNEYAWGNTTAVAVGALSLAAQIGETSNTTNANAVYNASLGGPARVGMFATGASDRPASGSSFYGIMDLSGNVYEPVIGIGNSTCRLFTGVTGDGTLLANGNQNVTNWPLLTDASLVISLRGGSLSSANTELRISDRSKSPSAAFSRLPETGGRGVR